MKKGKFRNLILIIGFIFLLVTSIFTQILIINNNVLKENESREQEMLNTPKTQDLPPAGYNKVRDWIIFEDSPMSGWTGGYLGLINENLPVDLSVTYNGLPSVKVEFSTSAGWGVSLNTLAEWASTSLEPYENGTIEFNVLGDSDSLNMQVGFDDTIFDRDEYLVNKSELRAWVNVNDYLPSTINTTWQHVSIPLSDIFAAHINFSKYNVRCFIIQPETSGGWIDHTIWLNNITMMTDDIELVFPEIKINQVGYLVDNEKYALVSGFPELLTADDTMQFEIRNAYTDSLVFSDFLENRTDFDPYISGEKVLLANFTDFITPGKYYMEVPGAPEVDRSYNFTIGGQNLYEPLLRDATRYYYYQRANVELAEPYAEGFPHKLPLHEDANAMFESNQNPSITKDVSGGWYDAGDFGKYVMPAATAVQDLLWTYKMFPQMFPDNHLNIPESGNGISDLLDEVKLELEWIMKMQNGTTGGFYCDIQATNRDNEDLDTTGRLIQDGFGYVQPTHVTADAVAVLAQATTFYNEIDSSFTADMLAAAELGWTYLDQHPEFIQSVSGYYDNDEDLDDRLWAAASLYAVTGNITYEDYFLDNYESFASTLVNPKNAYFWGENQIPAFFMYLTAEVRDSTFMNWFETNFNIWRDFQIDKVLNSAWRLSLNESEFVWGSNMPLLNVPLTMSLGSKLLGDYNDTHAEVVRSCINYLLGTNPLGTCFITGYGTHYVDRAFSLLWGKDEIYDQPKGYMVGGANSEENWFVSQFAGKCWVNCTNDWVSNEHTIYWNSPLIYDIASMTSETNLTWNEPPMDQYIEESIPFSYDINATSPSGIASYWVNDTTNFAINNNGFITNATVLLVGDYLLRINATDNAGMTLSAVITIRVVSMDNPIWRETPTDQFVEYGMTFSYSVRARDYSGIADYWIDDSTNFTIDSTGLITNAIALSVGVYTIEIRAYDPYDNVNSSIIDISVEDTTDPTWDTTPTSQTIVFGDAFSYDVDANDLSGIVDYWIDDSTNFTIDSNGLITNAIALSVGVYTIEIRAYDPYDNYCSEIITIVVQAGEQSDNPGIPGFSLWILLGIMGITIMGLIKYLRKKAKYI
ncbi:MAG: glycoside hydrolase family 9 protein [Candidatus Lokiarchaeota archaeon]|nr:glycoside hydrolase family 9 protein [Candidatus Lokiarchaeota archaeon]